MHFGEINHYYNWTRYFISETFDRLNYKDLISIFRLNLKLLVLVYLH